MNHFRHCFLSLSLVFIVGSTTVSHGFDMTRRDRTQRSIKQIRLRQEWRALVSVRVSEGQSQIHPKAKRGVRVMLNGVRRAMKSNNQNGRLL